MIFPDYLKPEVKDKFQLYLTPNGSNIDQSFYKSKNSLLKDFYFKCESPLEIEVVRYEFINDKKYGLSQKLPIIEFENMNIVNITELFIDEIDNIKVTNL
ncbi:hypothetical protein HZP54_18470 [Elizabethkingia anophelis]|nr:hypothetical protein [Elizabethkingia anophelis]